MSLEFLPIIIGIYFLILVGYFVWDSAVMIQEKKERQRKGLTDYYDNPIEEKNARVD